ncbi:LacI family DNA-binding transcriptional regulator [Rhizobium sp. TH2]|uniref:LacI family DNA-binding transcriptional regulator n=1 Tax=Rhizobium sp. TH2 TaxID=2775403 RepID=UPI002157D219|nr:LacI family DNA-binding transcriptional regulator [Rhizobium sp. TH2]UVC10937.1 LacI family DNA-binding transcriptional regulator [Rhizobium sp. TH2]
MAHAFLIKDIAFQAGLSTATVDRVINGRGGVRRQTAARIEAAINELRQQENAAAMSGRTYVFDIVMEAPDRFTNAVRRAFETEAAAFLPTIVRSRFHFTEQMRDADLSRLMARIRRRGSHGVVLKAPDTGVIREEVAMVRAAIPVITLVTDLPDSGRFAYAGSDNRVAGETAAYLIGSRIGSAGGTVLLTLSSSRFRGEEERERAFRRIASERYPDLAIVEISEGYGKDSATGAQVRKALETNRMIDAVYSIGGGNRAIIEAFETAGRPLPVHVAHDLDEDNLALLKAEKLSYVLHHNLNADAASVFTTFLEGRKALPKMKRPALSALVIITPFNIPA